MREAQQQSTQQTHSRKLRSSRLHSSGRKPSLRASRLIKQRYSCEKV